MIAKQYGLRRKKLMESYGKDALIILRSNKEHIRNGDVTFKFRQSSDLNYLTGFPDTEAVMVLAPGRAEGEYILFNQPNNPEEEMWTGGRPGQEGAVKEYGADQAFPIDAFKEKLPELMKGRSSVVLPLSSDPCLVKMVIDAIQHVRKLVRRGATWTHTMQDIEHVLHEMRLKKEDSEIELMRKAAQISAQAHKHGMQVVKPGMMEYQLQAEITHQMQLQGGTEQAYDAIAAGGGNASVLHYIDNNDELKDGDLVLVDMGAEYKNYASDITRTYPINGKFSPEQKTIYELVLRIQTTSIERLKAGTPYNAMQEMTVRMIVEGLCELGIMKGDVDKLIADKAYIKHYGHFYGHFIGMDVHDAGTYKLKDGDEWRTLEAGMLITVEPGIYISADDQDVDAKWRGIGVRIEDDVLITETGCEVLTSDVPKTVAEIEALMA